MKSVKYFLIISIFGCFSLSLGSESHWMYGTDLGSKSHWLYGADLGSKSHWLYGADLGSKFHWKNGTSMTFPKQPFIDICLALKGELELCTIYPMLSEMLEDTAQ